MTCTYDNANRLLSIVNRNGGTTLSSYTYTLDEVGNRTQMVDTSGTSTYTYDSLYRLTGVTYPNSDTQSYTYDAMGNRLTKVHNGSTTTSTYNDGDQMTASGGVSYTYDNNGNQIASGSDTFTWDAENRLTATTIGGVSGTYGYTGDGLRSSRNIGGSSVSFIWNRIAGLPSVLQDSAGNRYVYGHDLISVEASGGAQTYFLYDGLGSTTGLTNGSGTVTGSYTYDAFGAVRSQTGATTEWSYTGEQNDASGLEYLRARYYDHANGRFISRDPIPLLQRYAYANNNPISYIDPDGLDARSSVRRAGQGVAEFVSSIIIASACWRSDTCAAVLQWARDYVARAVQQYGRAARRAAVAAGGAAVRAIVGAARSAASYAADVGGTAADWGKKAAQAAAPYLQECLTWGVGGAFAGGGGGAVAGCAAGMASYAFTKYVSDDPFSQCAIWGIGAAATAGRNVVAGATAGACGAAAAGWLDHKFGPSTPMSQCAIWAEGGRHVGTGFRTRALGWAGGCVAGGFAERF